MQAFSFTVNGKEDFSRAFAKVQPEWLKLRKKEAEAAAKQGKMLGGDRDEELMDQACKNVSTKGFVVKRKQLR